MTTQYSTATIGPRQAGMLDTLGMCASSLCVAHCLLTPALLLALPMAGFVVLESELIDRSLAVLAIFISIMALNPGYRIHGNRKLMLLAGSGIGCLLIAAFVAEHFFGETGDRVFTTIGGAILVAVHWLNRSYCKSRGCCRP